MSKEKELGALLHRPVTSAEELATLERRVKRATTELLTHALAWVAVSGFLAIVNLSTTFFESGQDLASRVWVVFPVLGWGIGVAGHAATVLVAHPRALAAQRRLLAIRDGTGVATPASTSTSVAAASPAEPTVRLTDAVAAVRRHLGALDPPRLDLEASLEVAEREGVRLQDEMGRVELALASASAGKADPRRRDALAAERERLRVSLDRLRVTLANLEIDTLLLQTAPRSHTFASDALHTEAELLRAAVEGAQKAREALASDAPPRSGRESRRA